MKINYVACFYFGQRRQYRYLSDNFLFIKEHLNFLSTLPEDSAIQKATFVINDDGVTSQQYINELIDSYNLNLKIALIWRGNVGYSYAAWQEGVLSNMNDGFDYHFLIEDDYIPVGDKFYQPFIDSYNDKTAFSAVLVWFSDGKDFPSISNGLLSNDKCLNIYSKYNKIFDLVIGSDYFDAEKTQVSFLNLFKGEGFNLQQIDDEISKPFRLLERIISYGGSKSMVIKPIIMEDH